MGLFVLYYSVINVGVFVLSPKQYLQKKEIRMAVKLICEGPHKSVIKEVVCGNCGAELEYTPNDVNERRVNFTGTKYVNCPKCHKEAIVDSW